MTSPPTTRNHILQVAAALFNQRGFNGTSMADLAAAVGVTKSSLYHHFPSKQSLLSEIIDLTVNRVTPLLREVAESDLPVVERLHRAIHQHTLEGIRDQDAQACFMEEGRYLAPDFMAAHVARRDRYEFIFRNMFEEGIASGDFLDRDISLTVKAVLGMCNSAVRWYQPGGDLTPDEIATQFADLAVRGVTSGPETTMGGAG
jgi:AcrR family transcriptional regulator